MNFFNFIQDLNFRKRRLILILIDFLFIKFSLILSIWLLNSNNFEAALNNKSIFIFFNSLIGLSIYYLTGQYKALSRYVGSRLIYEIIIRNLLLIFILYVIEKISSNGNSSLSFLIISWILISISTTSVRIIFRDLLIKFSNIRECHSPQVAIYGAGSAGGQLAASLRLDRNYKIICFFDDKRELWGRTLNGISIKSPSEIKKIKQNIDEILLAIPSLEPSRRIEVLEFLQKENINVLQIPTLNEINQGTKKINSLRPIEINDLLLREPIKTDLTLTQEVIKGKNICVTGGGGSIGSELCRQIINLNPNSLVILEKSEPSLYKINQEINNMKMKNGNIYPVLGNACEEILVKNIFNKYSIDVVFHAAAYKHVPLVEINPLEGIKNNVLSTYSICKGVISSNVRRMIFISTDKAVRPTNVMGASKRLAEMIIQSYALESKANRKKGGKNEYPIFSMVRFGNVLGSSGSVVPLFRDQIKKGGPVTITHKNIIRYFMTIEEAVELVLFASELSVGGDLFLLDMGKPVKISDLAKKMIRLSGLKIKDKNNQDGIEILFTGLRPGEKLFEELLINGKSKKTSHPRIYAANENLINPKLLWPKFEILKNRLLAQDEVSVLNILSILVPEWKKKIKK